MRKKRSVGSLTQRRAGLVFTSVSRSLPPPKSEIKINIPTILKSSQRKPKRRALEKGCLRRVLPLRHGITREHSIAPACVRWNDQIRCFGGEIESRISDRDSRQIDRHTLSPTAVLAVTDPNPLNSSGTSLRFFVSPMYGVVILLYSIPPRTTLPVCAYDPNERAGLTAPTPNVRRSELLL